MLQAWCFLGQGCSTGLKTGCVAIPQSLDLCLNRTKVTTFPCNADGSKCDADHLPPPLTNQSGSDSRLLDGSDIETIFLTEQADCFNTAPKKSNDLH